MPLIRYGDRQPRVAPDAYVASGGWVVGDVEIGAGSSVWFSAVVRGDSSNVRVGTGTNIQDGAVLHTDAGVPCLVGNDCTIGHRAIVHACIVEDRCLIGMGAIVLSGARIGEESLVAAGSVVTGGTEIPPRSLAMGTPARRARALSEEELETLIVDGARRYVGTAAEYRSNPRPGA